MPASSSPRSPLARESLPEIARRAIQSRRAPSRAARSRSAFRPASLRPPPRPPKPGGRQAAGVLAQCFRYACAARTRTCFPSAQRARSSNKTGPPLAPRKHQVYLRAPHDCNRPSRCALQGSPCSPVGPSKPGRTATVSVSPELLTRNNSGGSIQLEGRWNQHPPGFEPRPVFGSRLHISTECPSLDRTHRPLSALTGPVRVPAQPSLAGQGQVRLTYDNNY
jgi:hypothetical protein